MSTPKKAPFLIHCLDDHGIAVAISATPGNDFGVQSVNLAYGDELEITPEALELSRDRNGYSFWENPETATRWGLGPAPEHVKARRLESVKARAREEATFLKRANPSLARKEGAAKRLEVLNKVLSDGYGEN